MEIRSTLCRVVAVAAIGAPFSLAVLGNGVGAPVSQVEQSPREALAFREYLVNLGRVPEGRPVPAQFLFANTGSMPLKILGTSPSCGCLVPRLEKRLYAPGEQGLLVVQADTEGSSFAEQNGTSGNADQIKEHFVDVRYDAGRGEQTKRINVKYILPARRVVVEPRAILVYQFSENPTEREVVITDRRTPPIEVTKVECLGGSLGITSEIATTADDPTRARIALTIPPVKERLRMMLVIHTSDREQPRISVPIDIQLPKADAVRVGDSSSSSLAAEPR